MIKILKIPALTERTGRSKSAIYADVKEGLLPPLVKVGAQSSGIPEHELDAVLRARIAGKSEGDIKELVQRLIAARTAEHAEAA